MLFNVFEPKLVDSLLYAMIEFFNHGTLRSQLSCEPHPFIRPLSRSRVYLCHFRGILVDSGSAVTAMSRSFFNILNEMGAPVGPVRQTDRRLRGANGSQIEISGCSYCMVSFLGLRAGFDILICDLSTDAIIGTDTLGSVLPHTLDIKKGLLFTEGGVTLQLHRKDAALSGRAFTVGHCSVPPHSEAVLHCTTRTVGAGRYRPRTFGGIDSFFREYRPGGWTDTSGPVRVEGTGSGVQF